MKFSTLVYFQGALALGIGIAMVLPLLVSILYGEDDTPAFLLAIALALIIGSLMFFPMRGRVRTVTRRESFAIVTFSWLLASALGALPFVFFGTFGSYVDAYFETMSGFTTTGASVLADVEAQPHGILIWRSLTQWVGGMGIIVLFVAIFPILGVGAVQLFEYEAPGPPAERLTPRIKDTAKALWLIYLAFSALEGLALLLAGLSPFDAVNHVFTTMPTGGYSTLNTSVGQFQNPAVEYIITLFMFIAGVNFSLFYSVWRGHWRHMLEDREFRLYVSIILVATVIIIFDLAVQQGLNPPDSFRYSIFQVVTIQTTTGYATADFTLWPPLSQALLLLLMLIGASSGSTGGGMKVVRIWLLVKFAAREVVVAFHPRAVLPLKIAGKPVTEKVSHEVLGFAIIYIAILFGATLFVAAFGLDLVTSFSAVMASIGNIGPGLGLVGPMANYSHLPDAVKLVLIFCMLVGRLEIWTVLVLLRPAFWSR